MSKFTLDILENVCELIVDCSHSTPKWSDNGIIVIRNQNIIDDVLNLSNPSYTDEESYIERTKRAIPQKDDIVITREAPMGRVCLIPENLRCCLGQRQVLLRVNTNIVDSKYLYWALKSPFVQNQIMLNEGTGATVSNMRIPVLKALKIPRFNKETEGRIVDILSTISQKIQLNTQTNQTLEAIAQAIFKSWFVDFDPVRAKAQAILDGKTRDEANLSAMTVISGKAIEDLTQTEYQELWEIADAFPSELVENAEFGEVPKGWELTTLSEICTMQNGYAFKSSDWRDNGIPVIKIGSVKPMIVDIESNGFVAEENKFSRSDFLLTAGDIVVGLTGYVGEVGRIPAGDEAMLNQRVAKFIPKKLEGYLSYYNFVYCLARQKNFKEYAELNAKGSAQANISTKELLNYPVCIGNKKIHLLFEKQVNSMLKQILTNSQENKSLSKTRDLLLPRLLSGEI